MRTLKVFFLITDLGFIAYWLITALHIIPDIYLFKDYHNSLLIAWNWSFLPLDLCISATGLTSVYLYQLKNQHWRPIALISLVLTVCSGLQALTFWRFRLGVVASKRILTGLSSVLSSSFADVKDITQGLSGKKLDNMSIILYL